MSFSDGEVFVNSVGESALAHSDGSDGSRGFHMSFSDGKVFVNSVGESALPILMVLMVLAASI